MPTISMFYGIIVRMLFMDNQQHNLPHIHVEYQGVQAWIDIHEEELMADWSLAVRGEPVFPIEPLR
jgi:hypothetical protein